MNVEELPRNITILSLEMKSVIHLSLRLYSGGLVI